MQHGYVPAYVQYGVVILIGAMLSRPLMWRPLALLPLGMLPLYEVLMRARGWDARPTRSIMLGLVCLACLLVWSMT